MSKQYAELVERISRIVRDRGDVELMVLLDRIVDKETEAEQAAALGAVVKILNQNKKPIGTDATTGSSTAAQQHAQAVHQQAVHKANEAASAAYAASLAQQSQPAVASPSDDAEDSNS